MTPAELERVKEIVANNDPATALALLEVEFGSRPKHRPAKVSLERKREMAEQCFAWYVRHGGKRNRIAFDAKDEGGSPLPVFNLSDGEP